MEKIITKQSVPEWIKKLEDYTIYAPTKREDFWSFEVVTPQDPEVIDLNYLNSSPSPKKVVFPPKEVFFEFTGSIYDRMEVNETLPEGRPQVILGIRPCDAAAIARMDEFFSEYVKDPYYLTRRDNTILVGLVCNTPPSPNCFCTSVEGSPHGKTGLDILMTDLGDDLYYVESLTQKGVQIMDIPDKPFRQAKAEERSKTHPKRVRRHNALKYQGLTSCLCLWSFSVTPSMSGSRRSARRHSPTAFWTSPSSK